VPALREEIRNRIDQERRTLQAELGLTSSAGASGAPLGEPGSSAGASG
jgi:hypothetical protein